MRYNFKDSRLGGMLMTQENMEQNTTATQAGEPVTQEKKVQLNSTENLLRIMNPTSYKSLYNKAKRNKSLTEDDITPEEFEKRYNEKRKQDLEAKKKQHEEELNNEKESAREKLIKEIAAEQDRKEQELRDKEAKEKEKKAKEENKNKEVKPDEKLETAKVESATNSNLNDSVVAMTKEELDAIIKKERNEARIQFAQDAEIIYNPDDRKQKKKGFGTGGSMIICIVISVVASWVVLGLFGSSSSVNSNITKFGLAINALESQMGTVNNEVATLTADDNAGKSQYASVQNQLNTISGEISTLQGKVNTLTK